MLDLRSHFSRFLNTEPDRLHFAAHSHHPWPDVTREWWLMWANSPLSAGFTATDWSELRDTARLHALYWLGDKSVAAELRLRVAKFGATPEDRARLRIQFAAADEADGKRSRKPARSRYAELKLAE